MASIERVMILMTPQQKKEISRRAAALELSLGGYMLWKSLGDSALLDELATELTTSNERARATLQAS